MARAYPKWEVFERLVARLMANEVSTDMCVTPNASVVGAITGVRRQLDVLIEPRHEWDERRVIVDAKSGARRIDVKAVEAFRGMMEDVGATHGYLVSLAGHTKGAERRAQELVSLCIVPSDRLEEFDPSAWPPCRNDRCRDGRVFWDGYPELTMVLQPVVDDGLGVRQQRFVHYVGKCDRCGRFHVLCLTCGDLFSPIEDDEEDIGHMCRCKTPWFWLASIELGDDGGRFAELHVCMVTGKVLTVDRRPA